MLKYIILMLKNAKSRLGNQLENVRYFYDFFKKHEKRVHSMSSFFLYLIDKSLNVLYCISVLVTLIQLGGLYVYNRYSK